MIFLFDTNAVSDYMRGEPHIAARLVALPPSDQAIICSIVRGEFNISGLQNKTLRRHLPELNSGQVSRLLKRLRTHGLIKKIGRTYKSYATAFGKQAVATALKLRELVIIPQLAFAPAR